MYFTYILYSQKMHRFYIGSCENLEARLKKHLQKLKGFKAKAKDWKIVYSQTFQTNSEALKRENNIKNWKSKKMIQKLIEN